MGNGPSLSGAVGKGAGGPFIQLNERAPRSSWWKQEKRGRAY